VTQLYDPARGRAFPEMYCGQKVTALPSKTSFARHSSSQEVLLDTVAKQHYARPPVAGPVVIPNCAEVKVDWVMGGMTLTNVLHGALTAAGPLNPAMAESIFTALKAAAATTTWLGHLHPSISLVGVRVKDLRQANQPTLASSSAGTVGTGTGTELPQDSALAVTLRTAFSGKGYTGRIYLPGLDSAQLADSRHWISTVAFDNAAIGFANAINTAMTGQGIPWVLGRRALAANTTAGAPPAYAVPRPADTIPIVAAALTDHRIDSQRKRLGR
jgi:hypothetical protein